MKVYAPLSVKPWSVLTTGFLGIDMPVSMHESVKSAGFIPVYRTVADLKASHPRVEEEDIVTFDLKDGGTI